MAEMRRHSEIGAAILEVHEAMQDIADIVRHHHERWDGRGYPDGLVARSIPLGGRIIAVADAFNAMTTDRIYRSALPLDRAWEELRANAGTQFDPEIVAVFEQVVDETGRLRHLDPGLERTLSAEVHTQASGADELHARLAMLPTLERVGDTGRPASDDRPVGGGAGQRAAVAYGEGCATAESPDGLPLPAPKSREVA
jgi:hypothetical protein